MIQVLTQKQNQIISVNIILRIYNLMHRPNLQVPVLTQAKYPELE